MMVAFHEAGEDSYIFFYINTTAIAKVIKEKERIADKNQNAEIKKTNDTHHGQM